MKKLSKEIGFSVLMSMTGSNAQVIKQAVQTLSSSAYDRSLEREADMKSVNYMLAAEIDPKPFIDFMYDLSLKTDNYAITEWVSTHPESEERAQYMLNFIKNKKIISKKILSEEEWENFKQKVKDNQ
ncbi:M48 family metalloprotease [Flavobacterium sp.]|uniref:M48 family metalloprotease n=1 Tax=Flavobacterium sp. TaxID=239 RepID=UPI0035272FB8